jgi:hypothetical protein
MAIKGKRKGRSRPRTVATAPRPFLVPPKTPLFQRPGTQVFLVVLFWAAVLSTVVGFGLASEADRRADDINQFTSLVNGALASEQVSQNLGASQLILPEMGQAIAELRQGNANSGRLEEQARDWQERALAAASKIGRIESDQPSLVEAGTLMRQGLQLSASMARALGVAARLEGGEQEDLLVSIEEQSQAAQVVFHAGFGKMLEERRRADLPITPGGGSPIPGGGIPGLPR